METLGVHLPSLLVYLVNFLLVLGLLFLFAYKPILRLMDQRADRIRESLEASERAREEAASSQQVVEDQLVEARREAQRIVEIAREAAERFRGEEMERARGEAENFVSRAQSDIQRERDAAIEEVRANFGELAITAAERVVRRSLDRQAHEDLIAQVLEEGESLRRG
jgi:F-type H+-transporting ATPase subunit b